MKIEIKPNNEVSVNNETPMRSFRAMKLIRAIMGDTIKDFSERIGVSVRTIEGWEQGRNPSKEMIRMVALILLDVKKK